MPVEESQALKEFSHRDGAEQNFIIMNENIVEGIVNVNEVE